MRLLSGRLPASWRLASTPGGTPGATLRAPDGATARLKVIRRRRLDPKDVAALLVPQHGPSGTLVTAPFLSPRTRQLLADAGASYADATGNLRLVLDRPAVFIQAQGAQKNPQRESRPLASLKGPAAARVVRALCDVKPPYGVRRLAQIAAAAPASVSRTLAFLAREALVKRGPRDEVLEVDWPALLRRWVQDYQFLSSNTVMTFLEPRGIPGLVSKLRAFRRRYAVTGSLAAARRAPVAAARVAAVYVDDPSVVANSLDLRPAEAGANVILARPLDAVVFKRTWIDDGLTFAAWSQVAADLFTSPGRAPSEGEELIAWMKKSADAWRT